MKDQREFTNYLSIQPVIDKIINRKQKDKAFYVRMVENCLAKLSGAFVARAVHNEESFNSWRLSGNSTVTDIFLNFSGEKWLYRIFSPLVLIPQANILPLYRECLELNDKILPTCSMCISDDVIGVVVQGFVDGLTPEHFDSMIHHSIGAAGSLVKELAQKFGEPLFRG
jgi:hypothetical protein